MNICTGCESRHMRHPLECCASLQYGWGRGLLAASVVGLCLSIGTLVTHGEMVIQELANDPIADDPAVIVKYDRFNNDPSFIGSAFNWSGVGHANDATWATMISPSYFVSANHYHPGTGDTVKFFYSNDPMAGSETRTVIGGTQIGNGDIWLGELDAPVSAQVAKYPIFSLPYGDSYYDTEPVIYTFGIGTGSDVYTQQRLGRNQIDSVRTDLLDIGDPYPGYNFRWDYQNPGGIGPNESVVQSGDSGGPNFVLVNAGGGSLPAVIGMNLTYTPVGSGSSFIPQYIGGLQASMAGGDQPSLVSTTPLIGDFNLDGRIDSSDIQAMLIALTDLKSYGTLHGLTDDYVQILGDVNGDHELTNADIQALLDLVVVQTASGGTAAGVAEPSALVLLLFGAFFGMGPRNAHLLGACGPLSVQTGLEGPATVVEHVDPPLFLFPTLLLNANTTWRIESTCWPYADRIAHRFDDALKRFGAARRDRWTLCRATQVVAGPSRIGICGSCLHRRPNYTK